MPETELLFAFLAATLVFGLMPGPALLYTAAQTLAHGRRGGFLAVFGLQLGGFAHVAAAALGLSTLFIHVPEAYAVVKLCGAAYLIWLGIGLFRKVDWGTTTGATDTRQARPIGSRLLKSFFVEVLNPKTALFFLSFLPQFTDPSASFPIWLQMLILGVIVNVVFGLTDVICVFLADGMTSRLKRSERITRMMRALGGSILIGLGVRLGLDRS